MNKYMTVRFGKWVSNTGIRQVLSRLFILLLLLLVFSAVQGQETATAKVRVFVFSRYAPAFDIKINGETVGQTEEPQPVAYTPYFEVAPGSHIIELFSSDEDESVSVEPLTVTLEADHRYIIAVIGNALIDSLQLLLVDETAAMEGVDLPTSAVRIFVHGLSGAPALDFYSDEELVIENLSYGEYGITVVPGSDTNEELLVTAADNSDDIILDPSTHPGVPHTLTFSRASQAHIRADLGPGGNYYFVIGLPSYTGEIVTADGGSIAIGDSLDIDLKASGERTHYTLTLENPAQVSITLTSTASASDAYLRILDEDGKVLYENDELQHGDSNNNAGFERLDLQEGTYIIEAATFGDLFPAQYVLTVETP